MNEISRRLKNIEKRLNVGNKVVNNVIKICYVKPDSQGGQIEHCPTEPIEENPQYIEQMKKKATNGHRTIVIYPDD